MFLQELFAVVCLNKELEYVLQVLRYKITVDAVRCSELLQQRHHLLLLGFRRAFVCVFHLLSYPDEMLEEAVDVLHDCLEINFFADLEGCNKLHKLTTVVDRCGVDYLRA